MEPNGPQATLPSVFSRLDANKDGIVSVDEIFNTATPDSASLAGFLTAMRTEMAIGAGGERRRLPEPRARNRCACRARRVACSSSPVNA